MDATVVHSPHHGVPLGGENESKPLFLYHVSKTDIRSVPCESSSPSRRDVVHAARQNNIPSLDSWDIARVEKDVNTVNIYNVTCTEDKELRSSERKEESLRLDDLILKCDQQIKDLSLRLESLNQELTVIREKEEEQERNIQKLIASEKLSLQKQLARVNEKLKERKFLASHAVVDAILRGLNDVVFDFLNSKPIRNRGSMTRDYQIYLKTKGLDTISKLMRQSKVNHSQDRRNLCEDVLSRLTSEQRMIAEYCFSTLENVRGDRNNKQHPKVAKHNARICIEEFNWPRNIEELVLNYIESGPKKREYSGLAVDLFSSSDTTGVDELAADIALLEQELSLYQ